jgi:hypothetical protein
MIYLFNPCESVLSVACLSVFFVLFRVFRGYPLLPQAKKSVHICVIRGLPFCIFCAFSCISWPTHFAAGKKKACPLEADFL